MGNATTPETKNIRFQATNPFGATVTAYEKTWAHITRRHPEIAPFEKEVKAVLEKPAAIRTSTQTGKSNCFAYEDLGTGPSGPYGTGIRAIVRHADSTLEAAGYFVLLTAYPPNPSFSSNVGDTIYPAQTSKEVKKS